MIPSRLFNIIFDKSKPLWFTLYKQAIFIFIIFLWKTVLCIKTKTYLSVSKYIFAYIIHRLQTVWNKTKSKILNSHLVKKEIDYYWSIFMFCSLHFYLINTAPQPKLHLKSPKHFISLASFHLNVYSKISICSPWYNAVFFNIQVSISMTKGSQWLCYVCVKEFPISYYIKIFHI